MEKVFKRMLEDGVSIAPILTGHPEKQQEHEFLYWELGRQQMARKGVEP